MAIGRRFSIRDARVERVRVPLKAAFVTAAGRKTETENVRLRLRLAGGAVGWGEASTSVVQAALGPARLERALRRIAAGAIGADVRRLRALSAEAWRKAGPATAAAAAFECALFDAAARAHGLTLAAWFGGRADRVETDVTISAWPAPEAAAAARDAARAGFKTLKIKVGTGPGDLERVRAAAGAHPRARIILDGNQGLSVRSALRLARACLEDGVRVELFEQPLPREDLGGMRRLARACPVPLAADESARTPAEALDVLRRGAAGAINVKVAKTGLLGSLEIVSIAAAAGAPLMIGCMQETSVGLSASVHLACGTGAFRWVDLDSDVLLAERRPGGRYRREGLVVTAV